jgi:hypothetical protein
MPLKSGTLPLLSGLKMSLLKQVFYSGLHRYVVALRLSCRVVLLSDNKRFHFSGNAALPFLNRQNSFWT